VNLLSLEYQSFFDNIVSFETIEHFLEDDILALLDVFGRALVRGGRLILSSPYMQEPTRQAPDVGFHLTFDIDENRIEAWLSDSGFVLQTVKYQNYETHTIEDQLDEVDFAICVARKI
jgi:cyclopropane fatty-acyl-phospholipid synthase-like methyltransferase